MTQKESGELITNFAKVLERNLDSRLSIELANGLINTLKSVVDEKITSEEENDQ
jgi:hypothetical protein